MLNSLVSKLKIGGIIYAVGIVKRLEDEGQALWGCTDYPKTKIKISKGINKQKQIQTLIHEIVHAAMHEAGLDEQCNDEKIVNPLGLVLYQVLNDNPELLEQFTDVKN